MQRKVASLFLLLHDEPFIFSHPELEPHLALVPRLVRAAASAAAAAADALISFILMMPSVRAQNCRTTEKLLKQLQPVASLLYRH